MRLEEITKPDPRHAELAATVGPVYEKLYRSVVAVLREHPPRGGDVHPERLAVVFPYAELAPHEADAEAGGAYREVAEVLARLGWRTDPELYRRGLAERGEERVVPDTGRARRAGATPGQTIRRRRTMRIARILAQAETDRETLGRAGLRPEDVERARKTFEADPTRRGSATQRRGRELVVVVSFDPLEAAHASVGRGWRSCWRIGDREEPRFRAALACGIATVWLTTRDDLEGGNWIDQPVARWLVAPYVDRETGEVVAFRPVLDRYHVYGSPPSDADRAIREAIERVNESLRRVHAGRIGRLAIGEPQLALPPYAAAARTDDAAWTVRVLLGERPQDWGDLTGMATLRDLDPGALERAAERAVGLGADPGLARELADVVAGRARPRSARVSDALIPLVLAGLVPADRLPSPEAYAGRLCAVLYGQWRAGGPPIDGTTVRRLWRGDEARLAEAIALVEGCGGPPTGESVPTADELLPVLERIGRQKGTAGERARDLARFLASGGRERGSWLSGDLLAFGTDVLARGRRSEDAAEVPAAMADHRALL